MSIEETRREIEQRAAELRELAASLPPQRRADLLVETVGAIYRAVSRDNPEGGGADRRDGPERRSLATVVDAAQDHHHATYTRVLAALDAEESDSGH